MCSQNVRMRAKPWNTHGMGVERGGVLLRVPHSLGSESCQSFLKVAHLGLQPITQNISKFSVLFQNMRSEGVRVMVCSFVFFVVSGFS